MPNKEKEHKISREIGAFMRDLQGLGFGTRLVMDKFGHPHLDLLSRYNQRELMRLLFQDPFNLPLERWGSLWRGKDLKSATLEVVDIEDFSQGMEQAGINHLRLKKEGIIAKPTIDSIKRNIKFISSTQVLWVGASFSFQPRPVCSRVGCLELNFDQDIGDNRWWRWLTPKEFADLPIGPIGFEDTHYTYRYVLE